MTSTRFLAIVVATSAVACATEESPTPEDYEQVSQAVGVILERSYKPDDGLAMAIGSVAIGAPPAWLERDAAGGIHIGTLLGLTFEIDVGCEVAGAPVACGPAADDAHSSATVGGMLTLFNWTGSFDVTAETNLAGLRSPVVTFDALARVALGSRFTEVARPVTHDTTFTITTEAGLTIDRATALPLSGSGRFEIAYERTRSDEGTVVRHDFDVAFSIADGVATYEIDDLSFRIDVRTGVIIKL